MARKHSDRACLRQDAVLGNKPLTPFRAPARSPYVLPQAENYSGRRVAAPDERRARR
jgi:hypothetical protein